MEKQYDVIIIGGGPGGYTAALYSARAALKTLVVEELVAGGQMSTTEWVENYPGFDSGIEGLELAQKMQKGAEKFGAKTLYARVHAIDFKSEPKKVYTTQGNFQCKSIILAMGASPRSLGLPNESDLLGNGLSYCAACDGAFFKGKTVAVIGGGNSALGEAITLSSICEKVFLIHHSDTFRGEQASIEAIHRIPNIVPLYHTAVTRLLSNEGRVSGIEIMDKTNSNKAVIDCDGIFIAIGRIPNTQLCRPYLSMDERGYIIADETTRTNVKGVFATGDLRTKPLRQIITAASDGAVAAMNAEEYIRRN